MKIEIVCYLGAALPLLAFCMVADAQRGFLSIDCGSTKSSYKDDLGLQWVNDVSYVLTGQTADVPDPVASALDNYQALQSFRHFPGSRRKSCYELPTTSDTSSLIRAMFFQGGSSDLVLPIHFSISINGTSVATVRYDPSDVGLTTPLVFEGIFYSPGTVMHFCLLRDLGVPFISSVELRPLDPDGNMYSYPGSREQFLWTLSRYNSGAVNVPTLRYPQDEFDRLWYTPGAWASKFAVFTSLGGLDTTTTSSINNVPSAVMQDAWISNFPNDTLSVQFSFGNDSVTEVYTAVYVQEIAPNQTSAVRGFTINFDSDYSYTINASRRAVAVLYSRWDVGSKGLTNFSLSAETWSILGPVVNGIETYAQYDFNFSTTAPNDVAALKVLQTSFNLTDWQGDPCFPVSWDWVACQFVTNNPATLIGRVDKILLSNMKINGTIPANISQLDALTEIRLDNNSLIGPIPYSLGLLPSLAILLVNDNDLSGEVPPGLRMKTGLTKFDYSGNKLLEMPKKSKSSIIAVVGGVIGGLVVLLIVSCIVVFYVVLRKRRRPSSDTSTTAAEAKAEIVMMSAPRSPRRTASIKATTELGNISMENVLAATNNFNYKLGEGSDGAVYFGRLQGKEVVVKVNNQNNVHRTSEFLTEMDVLTRVHHRNLVTLIGYCNEGEHLILVYEFQSGGTLRESLYSNTMDGELKIFTPRGVLDWQQRLQIAVDAAKGLEFLHKDCEPSIVHRDVKSSNILLDDRKVGKVADFGIHKKSLSESGGVKGTHGYLDPEYNQTSMLTQKSDVYSFGVVLAELISGQPPFMEMKSGSSFILIDVLRTSVGKDDIEAFADPRLGGNFDMESMEGVAELALSCLQQRGVDRPEMSEVVRILEYSVSRRRG